MAVERFISSNVRFPLNVRLYHVKPHACCTCRDYVFTHDSGAVLVNKRKVWDAIAFYFYMNARSMIYYGDVTVPNGAYASRSPIVSLYLV